MDQYQNYSEPVPKILHFIWIGSEIPKVALDYVKVWAVINPDYEINIWYDSNLLRLKALSDKLKGAALDTDSSKGSGYRDYIFMTRQISRILQTAIIRKRFGGQAEKRTRSSVNLPRPEDWGRYRSSRSGTRSLCRTT